MFSNSTQFGTRYSLRRAYVQRSASEEVTGTKAIKKDREREVLDGCNNVEKDERFHCITVETFYNSFISIS